MNKKEVCDDLKNKIYALNGVYTISMRQLRDNFGYKRVTEGIANEISEALIKHGISHYPKILENSQSQIIRLYINNTKSGAIIDAVLNVNGRDNDNIIRTLSEFYGVTIEMIRKRQEKPSV